MFTNHEPSELASLWSELGSGECQVERCWSEPDLWSVHVVPVPRLSGAAEKNRSRDFQVMEAVLLSGARKVVAADLGVSGSTVAMILGRALASMGVFCSPARIPALLVLAAHAHHHVEWRASVRPPNSPHAVSIRSPQAALAGGLPPSEHQVTGLLAEGHSYSEIAVLRQTSVRTVANQIASAFRRLRVSGRAELLCRVAERWLAQPAQHQPKASSVVSLESWREVRASASLQSRYESGLTLSSSPHA